jgi:hypothetical protein
MKISKHFTVPHPPAESSSESSVQSQEMWEPSDDENEDKLVPGGCHDQADYVKK